MIPLEDIPKLFASDPQEGLRKILDWLPPGTTATQHRASPWLGSDEWRTTILLPDGAGFGVYWKEPEPILRARFDGDLRSLSIRCWLEELVAASRPYISISVPSVNPLVLALAGARSVPQPIVPVARATDGDRLVANLRSRRAQ